MMINQVGTQQTWTLNHVARVLLIHEISNRKLDYQSDA